MSSEEEKLNPTPIQVYILTYLYSEDLKKFELFDSFYTSRNVVKPTAITLDHLITTMPNSMSSETLVPEEVQNQLNFLVRRGFLEPNLKRQGDSYFTFYSITMRGKLFIKGYITKFSNAIKDKKINEQEVDRAEGDSKAKSYLKDKILDKVIDKSLDQIAEGLILGIKIFGPTLATLLTQLYPHPI
jgi:hypothetical protein